jgi:TPR repeat protein
MNKSLAVHYAKWSSAQGNAEAQLNYGVSLDQGDGIAMNKSLAAHYYKLSADQGYAAAQFTYGFLLATGDGIPMNEPLAAHYFKLSADQGFVCGQDKTAQDLLGRGGIDIMAMGVECLRTAADQGLISA